MSEEFEDDEYEEFEDQEEDLVVDDDNDDEAFQSASESKQNAMQHNIEQQAPITAPENAQQIEKPKPTPANVVNSEIPSNIAPSEIDKLSYSEYIAYLYDKFLNMHRGMNGVEEDWKKVRAQINSALQLNIGRKYIEPLLSLEYSYEQREVLKFMLFTGSSAELIEQMTPSVSYKEMIARYEGSKVESAVVTMLDTPLNTMSKLVNDYKEDLMKFRKETEEEIANYKEEIEQKSNELKNTKAELDALKKKVLEDIEKKKKEEEIRVQAEQMAQKMFAEKKKEYELESRQDREKEELFKRIEMLENGGATPRPSQPKEKRRLFGFKKEKNTEEPEKLRKFDNTPLPANFDLTNYMMSANLSSSQLDVIALAVKCGLSDRVIKNMIDSQKDARQLKQLLEVFLAKRDKETQDKIGKDQIISQEDIIYDE